MRTHGLQIALSLVASGILFSPGIIAAAERSVPLLSEAELLGAHSAGITQGATKFSAGAILFPDQILSVDVPTADKQTPASPQIEAWSKVYRFIVIPINLAVQTLPGKAPSSVVINAAFRNRGQLPQQPIIVDQFPQTGFKAEPFSGNLSVGVGGDLKFAGAAPASANASVKAALTYTYAPAFANVQSGYASSSCYWTFVASQDKQPVGSLPLKLTVGIPRANPAKRWSLAFDIVATFGSSWWGDKVRTAFVSEIRLPP